MTSKALFIRMTSILMLSLCITGNCLAQNDKKPIYKFTDNRISQADTLLSHKDYGSALKAYQEVLQTYTAESFYEGMVYATERMAFCYRRLRNDDLSAETFQRAIDLAKEKLELNHMLLSKAYLNNGLRQYYARRTELSRIQIDSAYSVYSKSKTQLLNDFKQIIKFKFYTYLFTRRSQDSTLKYLNARSRLYTSIGSTIEEDLYLLSDYTRSYIQLGDFEKAKIYALEEVRLSEVNHPKLYSDALFVLGKTLLANKEFEEGLKVSNQLIANTLQSNSDSKKLSGYYGLKGVALNGLKRYRESQETFLTILDLLESNQEEDGLFYTTTVMNLGISHEFQGNYDRAETVLRLALNGAKKLKEKNTDSNLEEKYSYLGQLFDAKKQYKASLMYYDSAIKTKLKTTSESIYAFPELLEKNVSYWVAIRLIYKSKALIKLNNYIYQDSLELLNSALEHVEKTHEYMLKGRNNLGNANSKIQQASKFKDLYEVGLSAAYTLFEKKNSNLLLINSIRYMTRSKSLLFLNQVGDFDILHNESISSKLKSQFANAKIIQDSLDNQINQQIAIDPLGDSVMILNTEKMRWNARLAEVRETIAKEYPDASNEFLSKEVSIESLRADHQLSSEKALVEYFVGDSAIFVVGLSGEKASFHRIEKNETFNAALSSFLGEVNTAPSTREMDRHLKSFGEASHMLYNALLKPVLDDLGEMEELIIVPDEILSRVPFELLISKWLGRETSFKELNYLLKGTKVSHLLSSKISFNEFAQSQGKGMLGIGYVGEGIADERAAMGGLPGSLKEINFLKSNFEGDYYLGKEGTKRQFLKKAGDYDVIHLALHGISDSVNRYNSALVFNGDRDYYMTSTDLYRTRLKSRLAVLSACETGIGKISEGEGSFSIARGFAIAGVPAIVTTLWKVNDQAGASIMEQFYRNLKAGRKKDDALRQAKLKYMQQADNLSSSPFYWGNYILIGDTREIELKEKGNLAWYWVLITLLILGTLGLSLRRLSRKPFNQVP